VSCNPAVTIASRVFHFSLSQNQIILAIMQMAYRYCAVLGREWLDENIEVLNRSRLFVAAVEESAGSMQSSSRHNSFLLLKWRYAT
jgi:hypothetical protein